VNNHKIDSWHQLPYDPAGEDCERTYAELRVYLGAMSPDDATAIIGIEPTATSVAGRQIPPNSLGRSRRERLNAWFLSSEAHVEAFDIRPHLDWLTNRLLPAKSGLFTLQETEGVTMNVTIIWWAKDYGGPVLWPSQMEILAALRLECQFALSFYGDDS
jgi:hypothetical protein